MLTRKTERSPYRIDRRHIVGLLARCAAEAGAEISLGSRITGVSPDGTVTTEDGNRRSADLVVLADGRDRRCARLSTCSNGRSGSATAGSGSPSPARRTKLPRTRFRAR